MTKLPRKPSELIELALADLIKCERSPRYVIEMSDFHYPRDGVCEVCLAGAVMAQHLEVPQDEIGDPDGYGERVHGIIWSLDQFRLGDVAGAFSYLGYSRARGEKFDRRITRHHVSSGKFKREMRQLARDLRAGGY